jgi:hypothetical protein
MTPTWLRLFLIPPRPGSRWHKQFDHIHVQRFGETVNHIDAGRIHATLQRADVGAVYISAMGE